MSKLSWNEIRQNAIKFAREWQNARDERAEAQTFWNEFFDVFGVRRRTVAVFEDPVRSLRDTYHRIDLFWKGTLLAEHKSAGESFDKAQSQAFLYVQELYSSRRQEEVPRWIVLSDFQRFALYDLEPEEQLELPLWRDHKYHLTEFPLSELHKHVKSFAFVIGQKTHRFGEEDPANLKAAAIMADLHDAVEGSGYAGQELERLLVRLLFCLFADDTGIFERTQFEQFLDNHTREDGTDMGATLSHLFEVLNTPVDKRSRNLEDDLAAFPYINGDLFAEQLHIAAFNRNMRNSLRAACHFDWSRISPAVFGSLFQNIMDAKERREIGAHYTTERNILKVIRPLFLDALVAEFEQIKTDRSRRRDARLKEFHTKLTKMKFLDPACGCGNFLVIAYRELRRLELDVLKLLHNLEQGITELPLGEIAKLSRIDVNQFFGIEISEWASRIAETALWLTDHQMNMELTNAAGNLFQRIPLRAAPHIHAGKNALRVNWKSVLSPDENTYVLGNPPFIGAKYQNASQKSDVQLVIGSMKNGGLLDYVTMWYFRAAEFISGQATRCAFVSTNSISQGEQVGALWAELYKRGIKIHFAHRTFVWQSEAKGKAHVHVVIVGFGRGDVPVKTIYWYDDINEEPVALPAANINPYLIEGDDLTIQNRSTPLCNAPEIGIGNKPIDDGNYLFDENEKRDFLKLEPGAKKFFRPWIGSDEFINGFQRWCLWLGEIAPSELKSLPECRKRVEAVIAFRKASKSAPTQKLALTPTRFHVENFPDEEFLVIPEVSSERRPYIPMAFVSPPTICSNLVKLIPRATRFHFGVLTSAMHMAWVRQVCGRLESRYRYSAKLVYNNFPWPVDATPAQMQTVEERAKAVLAVRQDFLDAGQAYSDLYDPRCMPESLLDAHQALDRAVDKCYRKDKFSSERERVEFLFMLYEKLVSPLAQSEPVKITRRRARKR